MSGPFLVPTDATVKEKLQFLYGDGLKVQGAEPSGVDKAICASYVDTAGMPAAVAVCDVEFGAYAGGALSMLPVDVAKEAATSGELTKVMVDNLHEVMNICVNLLMCDSTPHLRLDKVYCTPADLPDAVRAMADGTGGPAFKVDFPRYGSGLIRFVG